MVKCDELDNCLKCYNRSVDEEVWRMLTQPQRMISRVICVQLFNILEDRKEAS